jgi:hypothetical protein
MLKASANYSSMKGYLACVLAFLALCMAIFFTACTENSAWDATYGGPNFPVNQQPPSESPPGSGSVPYVHEGPF